MPAKRPSTGYRKGNNKRRRYPAKRVIIKRARKLLAKPRLAIKKGLSAVNIHCFSRNRTQWINLFGTPPTTTGGTVGEGNVTLNPDGTYGILDFATYFAQYPDCEEKTVLDTGGHKYVDHNAFKELLMNRSGSQEEKKKMREKIAKKPKIAMRALELHSIHIWVTSPSVNLIFMD